MNGQYFDRRSEAYAASYTRRSPAGYALRIRQQRLLALVPSDATRVLDVGCGPGFLLHVLARRGHDVWGVDAAPAMVDRARRELGTAREAQVLLGDAAALPFPAATFDVVICAGVLDKLPRSSAAVDEMMRVVRDGGHLIVSYPNWWSPYAVWRRFVFYPAITIAGAAVGRNGGVADLPGMAARLFTAGGVARELRERGAVVTDIRYLYYNPFLSPLDELLPVPVTRAVTWLEAMADSRLEWLGTEFIVKAVKAG